MPDSPISYALPTRENLDSDEDWSRISDRKMKKRLQNRVAQREYRRRTRERIEGLTAELNKYRRQGNETEAGGSTQEQQSETHSNHSPSPQEDDDQAVTQPPSSSSSSQQPQQQQPLPQQRPQQQTQSQAQRQAQQQSIAAQQQLQAQRQQQSLPQQPEPQRQMPPQQQLQPPPQLQAQQQIPPQLQHQEQHLHQQRLQHHHNVPELLALANTVNTCGPTTTTIFPSLLQAASASSSGIPLPVTQPDAGIPHPNVARILPHDMQAMGRIAFGVDDPRRVPRSEAPERDYYDKDDAPFLPIDMDEDGDDGDDGGADDRPSGKESGEHEFFDVADGMSSLLAGHHSPIAHTNPSLARDSHMQAPGGRDGGPGMGPSRHSGSHDRPEIWDYLPGADASLEQRFDFLFDWVQHAGFGSLDHLLEVWYTGNFNESSPLRQEQRLSRHRGLTTLLAKLRGATHWSKWERWGYQEETLLGAESILRAEFAALMPYAQFGRHIAAYEACPDRDKPETTKALKRCLQDELPQLRTLLTAVTADSGKAGRHANRKAIDAATMVLSMAGRVSDSDLLLLLQDAIQNGNRPREGAVPMGIP